MQPTLPQDIAVGLPFVATALTHYFMSDGLAPWKNALIAAVAILATALLCIWLSGNFVAGNAQASILVVISYTVFLMRGPLSAIMVYFSELKSPFDPPPANPNPITNIGTKAVTPTAIPLPPGSSPIPPRASAQPPDTTA